MDSTPARVADLTERLGNLLRSSQRQQSEDPPLLPVHWQALHYLARCNRYSDGPVAVAEFLGLTKGTTSQTLRLLESRGLIAREDDTTDRRRIHLRLTAAGRAVLQPATVPAGFSQAVTALGESGDLLAALLEALLRELQAAHGSRTFGQCRTCRHFTPLGPGRQRCGLTGERLSAQDSAKICREHEVPQEGSCLRRRL